MLVRTNCTGSNGVESDVDRADEEEDACSSFVVVAVDMDDLDAGSIDPETELVDDAIPARLFECRDC